MNSINSCALLAYICSNHFESHYFAEPTLKEKLLNYISKTKRGLKEEAVPTLNLPGKRKRDDSERYQRMIKRRKISETITSSCKINNILEESVLISNDMQKSSDSSSKYLLVK